MNEKNYNIARELTVLGIGYFVVIILPYLIFGFSFIPWIISYPDLIDLLVYPLFMGLTLFYIYEKTPNKEKFLKILYMSLLIIHIEGHGFHWVANAIDVTIENVPDWGAIPQLVSLHQYAYFLDEILSHKIMFYSISIIMLLILYWSGRYEAQLEKRTIYTLDISSVIFGFSIIVSFIEGQSPIEVIIFAIALIILGFIIYRRLDRIYQNPVARYMFNTAVTILVIAAIYYMIFHGFPQPSEWL